MAIEPTMAQMVAKPHEEHKATRQLNDLPRSSTTVKEWLAQEQQHSPQQPQAPTWQAVVSKSGSVSNYAPKCVYLRLDDSWRIWRVQTGEQRSCGVELDISGEILPGWKAIATYAYTDAVVTEDNTIPEGDHFPNDFPDLRITAKDSFSSAVNKASNQNFGGTDASVAYEWMIQNNFKADVICFWTDSESWARYKHPSQALAKYREKVNPNIKAVYVTLAPYQITLVDPKGPLSWDLGGFDPGIPRIIQMLATVHL